MIRCCVAVASLLACSKATPVEERAFVPRDAATPRDAIVVDASAKPRPLKVTLDGAPVPIARRLVYADGGGFVVHLADFALDCERARNYETRAKGMWATLGVYRHLHADGTLSWAVADGHLHGTTFSRREIVDGAQLDAAVGAHSTLTVAYEFTTLGEPREHLAIDGTIDAIGCGERGIRPPVLPPQAGATIELAGRRFPIVSAGYIEVAGERTLVVADGRIECQSHPALVRADFDALAVELRWGATSSVSVSSRLVGSLRWVDFERGKIPLAERPASPPPGATELTARLGGTLKLGELLEADYTLALAGTVRAIVCPAD